MADLLYDGGLDDWKDWATGTFKWALMKSTYAADRTHNFISDVSAQELSSAGYARQAVTGATRTVNTSLHRIIYDCNDPTFGPLASGATVGSVLVFRDTGTAGTSRLMALFDIADYATDGSTLSPAVSVDGVHYVMQAP